MQNLMIIFMSWVSLAAGATPLPELPTGLYQYQGQFMVHKKRDNQVVYWQTQEGAAELKLLKKNGYTCLRNRPTTYVCFKEESVEKPLPEFVSGLGQKLNSFRIEFPTQYEKINLIHDGFSSQEWLVQEPYQINEKNLDLMKIVHNDSNRWYLVFPVDENQPVGILNYITQQQLGFSLLASITDSKNPHINHQYFIEAYFEPQP